MGRKYDLPFVQLVDEKGKHGGIHALCRTVCKESGSGSIKGSGRKRTAFDAPKFEHSYPHCWRCDTPLIYYARESWFIRMTAVRDDLIANNNTINWIPESIGKGRFGDWMRECSGLGYQP